MRDNLICAHVSHLEKDTYNPATSTIHHAQQYVPQSTRHVHTTSHYLSSSAHPPRTSTTPHYLTRFSLTDYKSRTRASTESDDTSQFRKAQMKYTRPFAAHRGQRGRTRAWESLGQHIDGSLTDVGSTRLDSTSYKSNTHFALSYLPHTYPSQRYTSLHRRNKESRP
jgi:hypothetical protein